jgi:hypothetical protein
MAQASLSSSCQEEQTMTSTAKNLIAAFLILFTGCAAGTAWARGSRPACPDPGALDVAGFWESRNTSKGGIGHTLEFRKDGTFVEATTVIVGMNYHVSGDRLFLDELVEDKTIEPEGVEFRVEGDLLVEKAPNAPVVRKERVGKAEPGSPPIVGVWRFRHDTGAIAYEKYGADGRVSLRLPLASSTGCYKVLGDRLAMKKPGCKEVTLPFDLGAGEFVLRGPGGRSTAYGFVTEGPWYDREHPPRL